MTPERIQRKRDGWKMPMGAVYVGGPSRWGNPYIMRYRQERWHVTGPDARAQYVTEEEAAAAVVRLFARYAIVRFRREGWGWLGPLRDKPLVCWCALDAPCHADILLKMANADIGAAWQDHAARMARRRV